LKKKKKRGSTYIGERKKFVHFKEGEGEGTLTAKGKEKKYVAVKKELVGSFFVRREAK